MAPFQNDSLASSTNPSCLLSLPRKQLYSFLLKMWGRRRRRVEKSFEQVKEEVLFAIGQKVVQVWTKERNKFAFFFGNKVFYYTLLSCSIAFLYRKTRQWSFCPPLTSFFQHKMQGREKKGEQIWESEASWGIWRKKILSVTLGTKISPATFLLDFVQIFISLFLVAHEITWAKKRQPVTIFFPSPLQASLPEVQQDVSPRLLRLPQVLRLRRQLPLLARRWGMAPENITKLYN